MVTKVVTTYPFVYYLFLQMENSGVVHMLKTNKTEGIFLSLLVFSCLYSHEL